VSPAVSEEPSAREVTARDVVGEAAAATKAGKLVVFPTDTVYGIGTRPDDPAATARLFEAKRRPRALELPVLAASVNEIRALTVFDDQAERLAAACWPGGLTLVLRRAPASAGWDLGGDLQTVGVRIPDHPLARSLLAAAGPLAVTSANRSGTPPGATCEELEATFGDDVALYLCQDLAPAGTASTVVDLAHGPARVLRSGAVAQEVIARLLSAQGPLLDSPLSP
jgi:L-threonylcarbamoyladenylate synthase